MIRLTNGHEFQYMAASGALGFDGKGWFWEQPSRWLGKIDPSLFTIVTKTLTRWPIKGNLSMWHPWTCVKLLKGGVVNAVGLTNPGFDYWFEHIAPKIDFTKSKIVVSIMSDSIEDLVYMVGKLNELAIVGIEINWSCPNVKGHNPKNSHLVIAGTLSVAEASKHPVLIKVGVTHDVETIIYAVREVAEAVNINSIPWPVVYPGVTSPLAQFGSGGGVSGQVAQELNWELVDRIVKINLVPVIGPSIWTQLDLHFLRNRRVDAFAFGSLFLRHPHRPTEIVRKDIAEQAEIARKEAELPAEIISNDTVNA